MRVFLLSLIKLIVVFIIPSQALCQTAASPPMRFDETYGAWSLTCLPMGEVHQCAARQFQKDSETGQVQLLVELHYPKDKTLEGAILVPNLFTPGSELVIGVDSKIASEHLTIKRCSEKGCIAVLGIAGVAYDKIMDGNILELQGTTSDGAAKRFSINLNGLKQAIERASMLQGK